MIWNKWIGDHLEKSWQEGGGGGLSLGTSRKDRKSMTLKAVIGSVLTQPMIHWKGDERALKDNDNILVRVTELTLILLTDLEHKGGGAGLSVTTHSLGGHTVWGRSYFPKRATLVCLFHSSCSWVWAMATVRWGPCLFLPLASGKGLVKAPMIGVPDKW